MAGEGNEIQPTPAQAAPAHDAIADDIFCQHCGYNLKMLTGERCPECGESIAGVRALQSQIPWVYRNELSNTVRDHTGSAIASPLYKGGHRGVLRRGSILPAYVASWWRAYWKTAWLVMFRRRRLSEEMARPVSYRDAQLFRFTTIAIVCSAAILASLSFLATHAQCPTDEPIVLFFWQHWWASAAIHFFGALTLLAATGVPSYFFHPRALSVKQQNRAVALSYYACAPLAMLPIAVAIATLSIILGNAKAFVWELDWIGPLLLIILLAALLIPSLYLRIRGGPNEPRPPPWFVLVISIAACAMGPWVLYYLGTHGVIPWLQAAALVAFVPFALWWINLIALANRTMPQRRRRAVYVTIFVPLLWLLSGLLIFVALPAVCFFVWVVFASLR